MRDTRNQHVKKIKGKGEENMKKVLAVILSLAMVLGMSLTSFAEDHKPVSTDEAVVTGNGGAARATVKAF